MAQIDTFSWSVAYHDDSVLHEYDEERPDGRAWSEIGNKPVKIVMLATPEVSQVHRLLVPEGAHPVFFRRRSVTINLAVSEQGEIQEDRSAAQCLAHCIGWKQGENGVYLFVFNDGQTLLTNELQAV